MEKGISKRIKTLRINSGLTQEQLAFQCDIDTLHLSKIEKGEIAPSEEEVTRIFSFFPLTCNQRIERTDSNEKTVKFRLNIVHIVQTVLLILCFFLPFANYTNYAGSRFSGFDMLQSIHLFDYFIVKMVFVLLVMQLIVHIIVLIKKVFHSNIFKAAIILTNIIIGVFLFIDLELSANEAYTILYIVLLVVIGIALCVFELIKYDLGHDFLTDIFKMRKVVLGTMVVVYLMFLIQSYEYFFIDFKWLEVSEKIFVIIWIFYMVVFPFLRRRFYESRLWVSLYILFAPISLFVLIIKFEEYEPIVTFVLLMMCLPILIVNIDIMVNLVKDFFNSDRKILK